MTTDREALRALAEAALSPRDGDYEYERLDTRGGHALAAALDSQTVLAILDERDALRAALPLEPLHLDLNDDVYACYACDASSVEYEGVEHWPDCAWLLARAASPEQGL